MAGDQYGRADVPVTLSALPTRAQTTGILSTTACGRCAWAAASHRVVNTCNCRGLACISCHRINRGTFSHNHSGRIEGLARLFACKCLRAIQACLVWHTVYIRGLSACFASSARSITFATPNCRANTNGKNGRALKIKGSFFPD